MTPTQLQEQIAVMTTTTAATGEWHYKVQDVAASNQLLEAAVRTLVTVAGNASIEEPGAAADAARDVVALVEATATGDRPAISAVLPSNVADAHRQLVTLASLTAAMVSRLVDVDEDNDWSQWPHWTRAAIIDGETQEDSDD